MSLLNDALKQAKQSQSKTPPPGAPPLPPLETKSSAATPWMLIVAIVFFALAILILASTMLGKHHNASAPTINPVPAVVQAPPPTNSPVASATNLLTTNAPAQIVEQFPKVQGIIYPVAIVDRKTVHVGDRDGDYKIIAISRTSVTFQRTNGSVKEIKLGQQ